MVSPDLYAIEFVLIGAYSDVGQRSNAKRQENAVQPYVTHVVKCFVNRNKRLYVL